MRIKLSTKATLTNEPAAGGLWVLIVGGKGYGPEELIRAKSGLIAARIFARLEAAASNAASDANVRKAIKEFAGGER